VSTNLVTTADAVLFNSTGLLFVVLGVFILIRMAGFPDLTVDGSFTIGAALYAVALIAGAGTPLSLFLAAAGGAAGGLLTWTINDRFGVGKVVSSVLSMIILLLSAPYVSGGSTKSLLHVVSIQSRIDAIDARLSDRLIGAASYQLHLLFSSTWIVLFGAIAFGTFAILHTRRGLRLRYLGGATTPSLLPQHERPLLLLLALMCGNALVALGGAIEAQRRGGFTNNMGTGMLLVALAVLILGESVMKSWRKREYLRMSEFVTAIVLGSLIYTAGIQGLLQLPINFVDIRLLTALFLLVLLALAGRVHSSSTRLF
jgi:putative ABC transport system permease protein